MRLPEEHAVSDGVGLHLFDARVAQTSWGDVDDSGQAHLVLRIGDDAEIGEDVFDFLAVVELDAAGDLVGDVVPSQGIFHHAGEGVHAIEDRHLAPLDFFRFVEPLGSLEVDDDVGFIVLVAG